MKLQSLLQSSKCLRYKLLQNQDKIYTYILSYSQKKEWGIVMIKSWKTKLQVQNISAWSEKPIHHQLDYKGFHYLSSAVHSTWGLSNSLSPAFLHICYYSWLSLILLSSQWCWGPLLQLGCVFINSPFGPFFKDSNPAPWYLISTSCQDLLMLSKPCYWETPSVADHTR